MADRAPSTGRDTHAELHRCAHDLLNDLAVIRMYTAVVLETASKNQVDPLLASIRDDLEQVCLSTEDAIERARLLSRRLQEEFNDEVTQI
jgi:signal transduction histidine kinase